MLLGARLCLKKGELDDIEEDWTLALNYLKRISSKSISAERCLKALEVMHSQLSTSNSDPTSLKAPDFANTDASPHIVQDITPQSPEFKPDPPVQPVTPFDPLSAPINVGMFPAGPQGNGVDWDVQGLVWSNLPWDWNLMDDTLVEGITAVGTWGWGNAGQGNVNGSGEENLGMPVL